MRVFVTGATGFIGSAIVRAARLQARKCRTTGMAPNTARADSRSRPAELFRRLEQCDNQV